MSVRAKFTVTDVHHHHWNPAARTIILQPIYDTSIPEDQRFATATPSGRIEVLVNNPAAIEQLPMGKTFYVDFTPVADEQATT